MLFLRALLFTILVPGTVAGYLPYVIALRWPGCFKLGVLHIVGLLFVPIGIILYGVSTFLFLTEGKGTPAIWFTKPLRAILGEEPRTLVLNSLYKRTRNPMYLGVTALVFGQAIWSGNISLCCYTVALLVFFHCVVVFIEEPHLKARDGERYTVYCSRVPRWLGFRKTIADYMPKS
jgi:protein-S-isoprenylcysteine O-methyltransferase Ste14